MDELKQRIEDKSAKIVVVGLGYVGLPLAVMAYAFAAGPWFIKAIALTGLVVTVGRAWLLSFKPSPYCHSDVKGKPVCENNTTYNLLNAERDECRAEDENHS